MQHIGLVSNDNKCFKVDVEIAKHLGIIRDMIEDVGMSNQEDVNLKLPNIDGRILEKVIEWATNRKDDPPFEGSFHDINPAAAVSEWDNNFMEVNKDAMGDLVKAANYLDIQPLIDAYKQYIGDLIKGKTTEQIKEMFKHFRPIDDTNVSTEAERQEKKAN